MRRWLVGFAPLLSAVQQVQPPTFRTGTNLVQIDALVTDREGDPVRDLRSRDDMRVFAILLDDCHVRRQPRLCPKFPVEEDYLWRQRDIETVRRDIARAALEVRCWWCTSAV